VSRTEERIVGEGKDAIKVISVFEPGPDSEERVLWAYMILLYGGEANIPPELRHHRPLMLPALRPAA
jgi:hypothetical protein